jgi:hypothetical protein
MGPPTSKNDLMILEGFSFWPSDRYIISDSKYHVHLTL